MITNYRHLTGPAVDEDCHCHCMTDRNAFQSALDEISQIITPSTRITEMTDDDLDEIREWLGHR